MVANRIIIIAFYAFAGQIGSPSFRKCNLDKIKSMFLYIFVSGEVIRYSNMFDTYIINEDTK